MGVPVHMSMSAFRGPRLHHFPLYSLRQGLSTEHRAHDVVSIASWLALGIPCLSLLSAEFLGRPLHPACTMWALMIHTSALTLAQQAFYPLSHLLSPPRLSDFYLLYLHALILCVCMCG